MWHLRIFTTKHTSDSLSQREPRILSHMLVLYMMSLEQPLTHIASLSDTLEKNS